LLAVRFLVTRLLVTHGVGPKTPKAQARRLRRWFPSEFLVYIPILSISHRRTGKFGDFIFASLARG
jgi:hypothetical protein